jgi:hypothetical protein
MTVEEGVELFKELFVKADYYDTYLMEEFSCEANLEEQ